jgi:hypothetical protein
VFCLENGYRRHSISCRCSSDHYSSDHCSCVRPLYVRRNGCWIRGTKTSVHHSYAWKKKTSSRRAMIFSRRPKTCAHRQSGSTSASGRYCSGRRSCVRILRNATAFYHHYDYWTSWLQPYESSVEEGLYHR